jgi:glycine C-acetyltransferase
LSKDELDRILESSKGRAARVCVVTDGVFSMRGDHAPLDEITAICRRHEQGYEEGIITVVDDSHGVGAFGKGGRGTEAVTGARADVLIATLGKAFGVNGGYVVSSRPLIAYIRETAPFYVYSNPITPAEAAASVAALDILESAEGEGLLSRLHVLNARIRNGLVALGLETIQGAHPIVPLMIRDPGKTAALVRCLFDRNVLVTGLNYPVVPKGDEEIRLQVCASHTEQDIDYVLGVLRNDRVADFALIENARQDL